MIGALELSEPGTKRVPPDEQTTPKAHSDRLQMLRSCRANLSAVGAVADAPGSARSASCLARPTPAWTDDDGVHHRLYRVREPGVIAAIRDAVAASPVVIADGHHRYSTSLAYKGERNEPGGPPDYVMAFIVELAPEQLNVLPIHRLLSADRPAGDVLAALETAVRGVRCRPPRWRVDHHGPDGRRGRVLAAARPDGFRLLRPRPGAFAGVDDLDSSRLEAARGASHRTRSPTSTACATS